MSSTSPPVKLWVILIVTEEGQDGETEATTYDGLWRVMDNVMKEDAC